ncbi:hypothetical protein C0992_008485 [Termitomyces sp. T32_za158]|nr:hypothetical protein C0992_008485 [Termitomyces sp. T32_za158]
MTDEQILGSEMEEWAAEKIVAHKGTRTNAMFEVLWLAGDKTWMNYEQVKELNLVEPYLELLGIEDIQHLPDGSGKPPSDDPQTYLGYISAAEIKTCTEAPTEELNPSYPFIPSLQLNATRFQLAFMGFHGRHSPPAHAGTRKPEGHPFIQQNPSDLIVTLWDPEQLEQSAICLHPLHLLLIVQFDEHVRATRGHPDYAEPAGYDEVAQFLNSVHPDVCHYRLSSKNKKGEWMYKVKAYPPGFLPTTFADPRLQKLVDIGFITENGEVDQQTYKDTLRAWRAPSGQKVQSTKHYHARQAQRKVNQLPGALPYNYAIAANPAALRGYVGRRSDRDGAYIARASKLDRRSASPVARSGGSRIRQPRQMVENQEEDERGYTIYNRTPPYHIDTIEQRVELLKELPLAPTTKPLPAAKKIHTRASSKSLPALVASATVKPRMDEGLTDFVMNDDTGIDPVLAQAELTDYRDDESGGNPQVASEPLDDEDAEGEEE